ncbi:MAG TPA: hypothetical protein VHF22_14305, partial [Planctomycetota bacterium]|nr:hypothetical protein [Planctomycetota bacterium]
MTTTATAAPERGMTFRNFGGVYQLEIRDAADLALIQTLDPARWAATSAPVRDLQCDPAFLAFVDSEKKGRIRVSQLIAARDWLFRVLAPTGRQRLAARIETLHLEDVDAASPEGAKLRRAAEHVLRELGAADRSKVELAQVRAFRASYAKTLANGDGIVCPEVIADPDVARLTRDIMLAAGSAPDASGRPGVGKEHVDRFVELAQKLLAWQALPAAPRGPDEPPILPWGGDTEAAAAMVRALDAKMEQYFAQCDLLRQEALAADRMHLGTEEIKKLDVADRGAIEKALAEAPLAPPRPDGALPLDARVNPLFEERFAALAAKVLPRALGPGARELRRSAWAQVKALFAPFFAWQAARPPLATEKLADPTLRSYVEGPLTGKLRELIALDLAAAGELEQAANVERAILYQRWLVPLVNNFVSFAALYQPGARALLEMGTLVIDGRRLEFSVRVENRDAHKKAATESYMFLVYAAISDQDGKVVFEVVSPVTTGERGRIAVGKRGIFIGLDGREWDAQVVDVVENAISIAEAIRAPFRRAAKFIGKKIEDFASSKLTAAEKQALETPVA